MITCTRHHDFSAGHRVYGHEGKCASLHGHNYRVHFTVRQIGPLSLGMHGGTDGIGRVIDFDAVKRTLCQWLEDNWDHKFLVYEHDSELAAIHNGQALGFVPVPFNPTAENMARFLVERVAPGLLSRFGVQLLRCTVEETRKCSATYEVT